MIKLLAGLIAGWVLGTVTVALAEVAGGGGSDSPNLWQVVTVSGPVGVLLFGGLLYVGRKLELALAENKQIREQYAIELRESRDRLANQLNNSSAAISNNAVVIERVSTATSGIQALLSTIVDFLDKRERRDTT